MGKPELVRTVNAKQAKTESRKPPISGIIETNNGQDGLRKQAREFGRMIRDGVFDYPAPAADPADLDPANPVPPRYQEWAAMVLVDSSAWIESLRRNGDMRVKLAEEGLLEAYEAQWCSPVRLEVPGGARPEKRAHLGKRFSVIPYRASREDDWDRAIALACRLRGEGLDVPWLDVLIASIAIHDGVRLYAIVAHFRDIAKHTSLLLYRPGYGGSFNDMDDG